MRKIRIGVLGGLLICGLAPVAGAGDAQEFSITIRNKRMALHHYLPNAGGPRHWRVILASGDGGWRGFEKRMAVTMAGWGYDVYGLNTRKYLAAFTHSPGLTESEAAADFGEMAQVVAGGSGERVTIMGWSAGAALAVLAGASDPNKGESEGIVAVSLPKRGVLGWHWSDNLAFLGFVKTRGSDFSIVSKVPKVAPLPLLIIQSSKDKWVPDEDREELFEVAIRPRRRVVLHGGGHSFPGARTEFFKELKSGFEWIHQQRQQEETESDDYWSRAQRKPKSSRLQLDLKF